MKTYPTASLYHTWALNQTSASQATINNIDLVPEVESDFQLWDLEHTYTGPINIKAKKTTPPDPLASIDLSQVPDAHKKDFQDLITTYSSSVLSYDKTDSNILKGYVFNLQMIDNFETFHSKPYNISPGLEHQLDELIEEYLEKGYLIPIQNPKITSSVFLVPKNSNEKLSAELDQGQGQQMKYRMVVDYRRLNQQVAPTNSCLLYTSPSPRD